MGRFRSVVGVLLIVVSSTVVLGACDDAKDQVKKLTNDAEEFTVRNVAAVAGTELFKQNGHELQSRLSCDAQVKDNVATVSCTGTTKDGQPATLSGMVNADEASKGKYVGKVNGTQVFDQSCLDCDQKN